MSFGEKQKAWDQSGSLDGPQWEVDQVAVNDDHIEGCSTCKVVGREHVAIVT